jgi:Bacterial Ig-like domain (group 3)
MNLKPILRLRRPASTCFYIVLCVAALLTGSANAQNPLLVTTTSIASSANPATLEQPITFTASVAAPGGTPTGMVVFKDGSDTFGTAPLQADGSAKLAISTLAVANHVITAAYGGDAEFAGSLSAPLTQVVDKFATMIAVVSSANPAPAGQPVALTATVKGLNGTATGTVTFNVGPAALGTSALAADGSARIVLSQLSAGSHAVVASFGGDARHAGSTSPVLTQVVDKSATTTTLVSSANPATVGHSVTFTARVVGAGGTPTGTMTLKDGTNILGFGLLSADGTAKIAVSTLASGLHAVTAAYEGDGTFGPSVSAAYQQMLEPASVSYQQVTILIATIIVAAMLVLARGVAVGVIARIFRWLLRPIWHTWRFVVPRFTAALRFLRILSRRRPQRPADAFLGLSCKRSRRHSRKPKTRSGMHSIRRLSRSNAIGASSVFGYTRYH